MSNIVLVFAVLSGIADLRSTNAQLQTVTLLKEKSEQLGFSIRGGSEHGLGIYVSEVDIGSAAGLSIFP